MLANPNLDFLQRAVAKLEPILEKIAFVGGCVTGLLVTDPGAAPVRPTIDVDAVVEVASYADFVIWEEELRQLGLRQSYERGAIVCRWIEHDLILDFMPADASILGFTNTWYKPAMKHVQRIVVGNHEARIISAPYFLATKLEAFRKRGKNNFRTSRDLEDIVTVIDGRAEILVEVENAEPDLKKYLGAEFNTLIANREFLDALSGYLLPDPSSQQRIGIVIERMRALTGI